MIAVVHHIHCVDDWKEVSENQIEKMKLSGLYDKADIIHATLNTKDFLGNCFVDENTIIDFFKKYPKIEYSFHENRYEYAGINKVWELGQKENMNILYIHAKGVSNKYRIFNKPHEKSQLKIDSIKSWRELLEYFVIEKWQECVEKLETFDNVGVTCNNSWYWGNFWWTQTKHIKNKTAPPLRASRWDYEAWLNANSDSTNFEFYRFTFIPYRTIISKKFYDGTYHGMMDKLEILSAHYGSFNIQTDEGRTVPEDINEFEVTDLVSKYYNENKKISGIPVGDYYYGGDPHYGFNKQLRIKFKVIGFEEIHEIVFDENRGTEFNFI